MIVLMIGAVAMAQPGPPPKKPPVQPPSTCAPADSEARPWRVAAEGAGQVSFCLGHDTQPTCWLVDVGAGSQQALAAVAAPRDGSPPDYDRARLPAAPQVKTSKREVTVCIGTDPCKTFKPKVGNTDYDMQAAINESGTLLATASGPENKQWVDVFDVASGKSLAHVRAGTSDDPCVSVGLAGDTVIVDESNCAGPDDSAWLVTKKGKKLAKLGSKKQPLQTAAMTPVRADGDVWAFNSFDNAEVVLQNVKTGKLVARVALPDPGEMPSSTVLVADGAGKVLVIGGGKTPGRVIAIDVATRKIVATHELPACAPPAQP
jgi:hypothetical protein